MKFRSRALYSAIVAVLASGSAIAAEDPAGAPDPGVADVQTLGEIQVTATKRETPLQKTPIAVSVINANTLDKQRVTNIIDITSLVPSLAATTEGDHGVVTLTMRGIGNDSAKTEYADPEVALFVDGVYAPRAEAAAGLLLDLDTVEALRGPQGTLWGRNSTVGAINFQTAKPQIGKMFGYGQMEIGDYNHVGMRAAVNVPVSDTFAFRIAVAQQQHDGYVDYQSPNGQLPSLASQQDAYVASGGTLDNFHAIDPNIYATSGQKYSSQDQTGARISTLWTPTATLSWNLSLEYFRDRGTPLANLMQTPRPGQDFWSILADTPAKLERDGYALRSRVDWDVSEAMALSYIAGFSKFDGSSDYDQDGGVLVPTSFATGSTFQDDRTNYEHFKS
ncbi:MAG: TonB-dependent receptor plug domain-containing protein, partial [Dokdonella sp.]